MTKNTHIPDESLALLPCPCCDCADVRFSQKKGYPGKWAVTCQDCKLSLGWFDSKQAQAARWNRRASVQQVTPLPGVAVIDDIYVRPDVRQPDLPEPALVTPSANLYSADQVHEHARQYGAAQQELLEAYDAVLRNLALSLSAGGWNSEGLIAPEVAERKIRWGIDDHGKGAFNFGKSVGIRETCEQITKDQLSGNSGELANVGGTVSSCLGLEASDQYSGNSGELESAGFDREAALKFIDTIINAVFAGGDWDGGSLQDLAVQHGLLKGRTVELPCSGEGQCDCALVGAEFPTTCYLKTYSLSSSAGLLQADSPEATPESK